MDARPEEIRLRDWCDVRDCERHATFWALALAPETRAAQIVARCDEHRSEGQ